MFVPVACSQCGKPFQVPESALGKPAACPWCQSSVLALPVATTAEAQPAKPPAPEPLSLDDAPATPSSRPPSQSIPQSSVQRLPRRLIALVLLAAALMAVTAAATLAVLRYRQGYMVNAEWQEFVAPDGSCRIELLGQPAEEDSQPDRGERRYVSSGWYSGAKAWIGWRTLTQAQVQEASAKDGWVALRKTVIDPEAARLIEKSGGYLVRDATIRQNPETVEIRLDGSKGPAIERVIVAPNGPRPRVYFLGMSGRRLQFDGPEVQHFFDSFHIVE
jgi:DNA-directed RNA polymerase subunit RPC12/RpoP